MDRLINANELIKEINKLDTYYLTSEEDMHMHDSDMVEAGAVRTIIDDAPTVEAIPKSAYEQVKWERDMAIQQLNDYGVQFCEKADCVRVVRCKDCELGSMNKFAKESGIVYCKHYLCSMQADDFCSYGDRRDGD